MSSSSIYKKLRSDPLGEISRVAGDVVIEAEERPYGSGKKREMTFSKFSGALEHYYMTTQKNQDSVVSDPLREFGLPRGTPVTSTR